MQLLKNGVKLLVALALISSFSCRKDRPPAIDICIADGFGGADCILKNGVQKYLSPSETVNMWMTTQNDMALFSAWCYKTNAETVRPGLDRIRLQAEPMGKNR